MTTRVSQCSWNNNTPYLVFFSEEHSVLYKHGMFCFLVKESFKSLFLYLEWDKLHSFQANYCVILTILIPVHQIVYPGAFFYEDGMRIFTAFLSGYLNSSLDS